MSKKNIGVITQPTYLPWLGYFEQIAYSNIFIFLDNVQFPRRGWCSRNRILNNGKEVFLTVPIVKSKRDTVIQDTEISYQQNWIYDHLKTLEYSYKNSPHFEAIFPLIKTTLEKKHGKLADLNIELIRAICDYLGVKTEMVRASQRTYSAKRTYLLKEICQDYKITHYYTSAGAKVYLDKEGYILTGQQIKIEYQNYEPIVYNQVKTKTFIPYLSIVDMLCNVNKREALELIKTGARH